MTDKGDLSRWEGKEAKGTSGGKKKSLRETNTT